MEVTKTAQDYPHAIMAAVPVRMVSASTMGSALEIDVEVTVTVQEDHYVTITNAPVRMASSSGMGSA